MQNKEKFGFIPLGNCSIPNTDNRVVMAGSLLDIHGKIKNTKGYNFQNAQVLLPSKFNLKLWEKELQNYWDRQLLYLLRYGFPLDVKPDAPLISTLENHSSAIKNCSDVQEYLEEEMAHGAILGPFKSLPIRAHVSPFLTRPKPDSHRNRVIVDLSFPSGAAVNSFVQKDVYLDTPFLLTLPTVDHIAKKIISLGKGSHIFKIDVSRAFRHIKIDPKDYVYLGLKNGDYFLDSSLPFGFRHGTNFFQRLSDSIRYIASHFHDCDVINYVDDICGFSLPSQSYSKFITIKKLIENIVFTLAHF